MQECIYYKEKHRSCFSASKDTGQDVNVDKTKYMVMSRDKNVGWSCDINLNDSSFDRM